MSGNGRYTWRMLDSKIRERLIMAVTRELGEHAVPGVVHLADNAVLSRTKVVHYLVWSEYRHRLSTTESTPYDIIQDLAPEFEVSVRTVERLIAKKTTTLVGT